MFPALSPLAAAMTCAMFLLIALWSVWALVTAVRNHRRRQELRTSRSS